MDHGAGPPHGGGGFRGGGRERLPDIEGQRPAVRNVLSRFLPFIVPHKWAIIFGTSCVMVGLVLQKLGPLITRHLVDHALTPVLRGPHTPELYATSLRLLIFCIAAMLVVDAVGALISRFRMYIMHKAGAMMVLDLRTTLYRHLQRLSLSYYESRQTGEIMSRVTGDVNAMEQLITHVSDHLLADALNLVVTLAILFALSWQLALVALVPVPVILFIILRFARRIRPIYRQIRNRLGDINAKLQDNLAGIRVIKSFHTEDAEYARFERESRQYFDQQMEGTRLWTTIFPLMRFVQGSGHILVAAVGGYMLLQPEPVVTLGTLFAFNAYVMHLYQPIGNLFRMYDVVLRSVAAGERVVEVLDEQPEVPDAPDAIELPPVEGQVCLHDVTFAYKTGEKVLQGVSIEAKPGETIALVGRSGAGKTSMVNLIPRFYDPLDGCVTIDGHDVRSVTTESLRSQIAIVLQDAFLFNGTILENIRYGRAGAIDEDIRAAAKAAYAEEFIEKLPDKYNTEIGERGVKLSGGQKQRISIARALLADRRILILDEATSMVDTEAEILIQCALARLMEGRTTFVIAHRLSTVKNADKIVALENGRVVETGDHATLLAKDGAYAQMYNAQFQLALDEPPPPAKRTPDASSRFDAPSLGNLSEEDSSISIP